MSSLTEILRKSQRKKLRTLVKELYETIKHIGCIENNTKMINAENIYNEICELIDQMY